MPGLDGMARQNARCREKRPCSSLSTAWASCRKNSYSILNVCVSKSVHMGNRGLVSNCADKSGINTPATSRLRVESGQLRELNVGLYLLCPHLDRSYDGCSSRRLKMSEQQATYLAQCLKNEICPTCHGPLVERHGSGQFKDGVFCSFDCDVKWRSEEIRQRHIAESKQRRPKSE